MTDIDETGKTADLSEASLEEAIRQIQGGFDDARPKPDSLIVTEQGLDFQARALRDGAITEAELRSIGSPEELIAEVKRRAETLT